MTWPLQLPARLVCVVRGHVPLLEQDRDVCGRLTVPHALRWVCRRCRADLGETVLLIDARRRASGEGDREVWR